MSKDSFSIKLEQKKRTVKDLADYIRTKSGVIPNYSLFLGAGASVTSGIKTAVELVDRWREEVYERFSTENYTDKKTAQQWLNEHARDWYETSNEYSSLFEKKFDLPSQRRRFVEEQVDKKLPSIGYAYLVELFDKRCFDTVFTTNFDDLINEAFYQFSAERPLLCAHDSSIKGVSITSSRPKIIKLHGDYLFDGIKSSLNETESLEVNTKEKLIEFTKEYGLIFVGYAGNDKSIMEVINFLLKQEDYLRNGIYWCHRKNDPISTELTKFLLRERVYLIEIEGFDELMAELFHEINLGEGLSLGGALKSTKRERMIDNFIKDSFSLSSNKFIGKDLRNLRKQSFTQDISSIINELSDDGGTENKIPEAVFRVLIYIDGLIKNKNFTQAEKEIKGLVETTESSSLRVKLITRLIEIYSLTNNRVKLVEECDKLIEIDRYNLNYALLKQNAFSEDSDKIIYLKSLLPIFKYSTRLRNSLASLAINYIDGQLTDDLVSFQEINEWLNESLVQDGTLDNAAWTLRKKSLSAEYAADLDNKKCDEKTEELLKSMWDINPTHTRYVTLKTSHICEKKDFELMKEYINHLDELYKISAIHKRKYILRSLCVLHTNLNKFDDKQTVVKLYSDFFDKYFKGFDEDELIAPLLTCRAGYLISHEKDINAAFSLAKKSVDAKWADDYAESIYSILIISEENFDFIEEFLENLPSDANKFKLQSSFYVVKKNYADAMKFLDKAHDEGISHSDYILNSSFINLCAGNYDVVISEVDSNIECIKSIYNKDVLVVNRELAKKKINNKTKDNEIRSIISHKHNSDDISMCAYFLLDDELNAMRILKANIEKDYMNYFLYKSWPVVPSVKLEKAVSLSKVA